MLLERPLKRSKVPTTGRWLLSNPPPMPGEWTENREQSFFENTGFSFSEKENILKSELFRKCRIFVFRDGNHFAYRASRKAMTSWRNYHVISLREISSNTNLFSSSSGEVCDGTLNPTRILKEKAFDETDGGGPFVRTLHTWRTPSLLARFYWRYSCFSVHYRVMGKFGEHERSVRVARGDSRGQL